MSKIATEQEAVDIGGKIVITNPNKCATKDFAISAGCKVSGSYSSNQLVQKDDLSRAELPKVSFNVNVTSTGFGPSGFFEIEVTNTTSTGVMIMLECYGDGRTTEIIGVTYSSNPVYHLSKCHISGSYRDISKPPFKPVFWACNIKGTADGHKDYVYSNIRIGENF